VPTVAAQWGESSLAGPLLAALAFGSVLGALWFGGRRRRGSVIDRYLLAVFLLGVLLAPVGLARGPVALSLLLIAAGLALGPATVSLFETLDVVAPGSGAESLTWVTTAEAGGTALGSAVAGPVVLHAGIGAPFVCASLLLVVPVGAVLARRGLERRRRP